jgi:hypothetical protein
MATCPLPRLPLRNGHLSQMAYSLFLFIRDVADGDLVGWIDAQLSSVNSKSVDLAAQRQAIISPLRNVYGASDKVLAMALSNLLLSAGQHRPLWREVGATMVVVDTLVVCTELESCGGSAPTIPTAIAAIGPTAALTFSLASPPTLMPASSIRPSPKPFHALFKARSGVTAPATASTFAMAIASMTMPLATIGAVSCFATAIA